MSSSASPAPSRRKTLLSLGVLALLTGIVVFIFREHWAEISEALSRLTFGQGLLALAVGLSYPLLEGVSSWLIVRSRLPHFPLRQGIDNAWMGTFGNVVGLGAGSVPFQTWYLHRRGLDVAYLTASPDDPALQNPYAHVHAEFLGEGNKAFAKLNFLRANVLLSTTPGLDVYQWKRSPSVDCYVHILHAANEVAGYRMFGIDYYDTVFVSGDYQIRDLRALEALRGLPAKEVVKIGIPYMDEMKRPHRAAQDDGAHRAVLGAERDLQQIRRQDHRQAARRRLPCHHSPAPPVVQVGKGHDRQAHGRLPGLGGSGVEPRQR